jgi:RNA polymerase sigma-54 factor
MEDWTPAEEDLPTFVLRQIAPDLAKEDRGIAAHILNGLDEDGLLRMPLIEIARYHHVPISRVERVIGLIQRAEPIGVGSCNPQEALLAQLKVLAETRPVPPLAESAIRNGMNLLSRRAHTELAKLLGISQAEAEEIAAFVASNLNPYPGRAHWGDLHSSAPHPQTYDRADIIIRLLDETQDSTLVVEIISPYAGALRVNPLFRKALMQAPKDKLDQWQADLENAALLIKCLQQRDHTLVRLMKKLVIIQRNFILQGEAHLQPLTRAHMAEQLEVHESTISRAVAGKTIELPNKRIIPLSMIFDRSLPARTILKNIIEQEEKPLSDQQLTELLHERGFTVARRTVAKYRAMEGILPARMR